MGHSDGSTLVAESVVPEGIYGGTGLNSFFSDISMFTDLSTNAWLPVKVIASGSAGRPASMTFSLTSLLWLFPTNPSDNTTVTTEDADRPYKGTLNIQLGLWLDVDSNGTYDFVPIHGNGGDNTTVLTALSDATTWEGDNLSVTTDLFDTPTFHKYTDENEYGILSSTASGINYYPNIYRHIWPSTTLWIENENRIAGRYWNQKNGSFDSGYSSAWDFGDNYLINNQPNSPYAHHLTYSSGPDTGSIHAAFFWDDIYDWSDENEVQDSDPAKWRATTYWDNRNIFSTPVPNKEANYGIGYCNSKGVHRIDGDGAQPYHIQTLYDGGTGTGNTLPIEEIVGDYVTSDYYGSGDRLLGKEYVCFPHPNTATVSLSEPEIKYYYGWAGWNSIAHHLIKAINAYSGSNNYDKFSAKFTHYDYLQNPSSDVSSTNNISLLAKFNDVVEYTNRINDTITITSDISGVHLNEARLAVNLTSTGVTDVGGTGITQVAQRTLHSLYQADPSRGTMLTATTAVQDNFFVNKATARYLKPNDMIKIEEASDATLYEFMMVKFITPMINSSQFLVTVDRAQRGPFQGTIDTATVGVLRSFSAGAKISKFEIHPMGYERESNQQTDVDGYYDNENGHARDWGAGVYILGEKELHGGSAEDVFHKVRVYFGGNQNDGDVAVFNVINNTNPNGENMWSQTLDQGPVVNASNFTTYVNESFQLLGITAASPVQDLGADSGNTYGTYYVDVQADSTAIFDLRIFIFPSAIINGEALQSVDEEFSVLMHKTDTEFSSALTANPLTDRFVGMSVFSKKQNSWLSSSRPFLPEDSETWSKVLNWYDEYKDGDYTNTTKPFFWNDSSQLRIIERNFKLNNPNKILKFSDLRNWFQNLNTVYTAAHVNNDGVYEINEELTVANIEFWGFSIFDTDKSWKYSAMDTASTIYSGLKLNAYGNTGTTDGYSNDVYEAPYATARADFEKGTTGGVDWTGVCRFYASAVFSDGSETLPVHQFHTSDTARTPLEIDFTPSESNAMDDTLKFRFAIKPFYNGEYIFGNPDVKGLHFYYTNSEENFDTFWSLGMITWNNGFTPANEITTTDTVQQSSAFQFTKYSDTTDRETFIICNDTQEYYEYSSMPKLQTFETLHGYSPYNVTLNARYKTHCIAGRRSFIGNVGIKDSLGNGDRLSYFNDKMIISPVNQLDTFPYPYNEITVDSSDGDEIIKLESVGDRVLQFKKNILYILNIAAGVPSEYFLEDKFRFRGAESTEHIVKTSDGVFWINNHGAFYYEGDKIIDLMMSGDETENKLRLDKKIWNDFVNSNTLVGYEPSSEECFVVKKYYQTEESDGDCYVYNIRLDNWSFGRARFYTGGTTESPRNMTNIVNMGINNELSYIVDYSHGDSAGGIPE